MNYLKGFHLVFGFIILIVFLMTGQYMRHQIHVGDMELGPRALTRAGHIYILLASLLNLALGAYLKISQRNFIKIFQVIGSILIIIATGLLIYSFMTEVPRTDIERHYSRLALYGLLAGTLCHSVLSPFDQQA